MHLLFDLDGTLTDSRVGIVRCIQAALTDAGAPVPAADELTRHIGPPLPRVFATLLGTSDTQAVETAMVAYRRRYELVGIFENTLYPDVTRLLEACAEAGHQLCLVTAKPHVYARQILEHFDIGRMFHNVYGPELRARNYTKESLIADACRLEEAEPGRTAMIGDRAEDVLGARANGLRAVGAAWGYGGRAELEAAHPTHIVGSPAELIEYIRQSNARLT